MTPSLNSIREDIRKQNYTHISFPLSHEKLSHAASHFLAFLALPQETKERFKLLISPFDRESFVGYRRRDQQGGDLDGKEYFHYNRYAEEGFSDMRTLADERISHFFSSAGTIYEETERVVERIIKEFDAEFPGIYDDFFPLDAHPHFYLRFLKYDVQGKGKFLAAGHYDQGACTLALAESAQGLRIGRGEETLREIEHADGHAIFMPGLQLRTHTSDEFIPAWHDVVQRDEDVLSEDVARWAIVFFADPVEMKQTTWEERHTPLY